MKMVYTNENRLITGNVKNILEANGIDVILKNEFTSGAVGEVSPFDAWVEVWVVNDGDYQEATKLVENALSPNYEADWICGKCQEENDATFEICWKCQSAHP